MNKKININFSEDKIFRILKGKLFLYNESEDEWVEMPNDSIASYKNTIIKIVDLINNTEFYSFLNNSVIKCIQNTININASNSLNKWVVSKNTQTYDIKSITQQLDKLNTIKKIGATFEEEIQLKKLQDELFQTTIKQELNLVEEN